MTPSKLKPSLNAADIRQIYDLMFGLLVQNNIELKEELMAKLLTKEEFYKTMKQYVTKEEFYNAIDPIAGQLKSLNEEVTVLAYHSADHNDRLERLEDITDKLYHLVNKQK